ncbi:MAG: hypothetical protein Kow00109_05900 [Acidobacteriota bacterium]
MAGGACLGKFTVDRFLELYFTESVGVDVKGRNSRERETVPYLARELVVLALV